jgi:hypothetical protein
MFYKNFTQEALYDLLNAYDIYIYKACDAGLMQTGWMPCGVEEFYENEYQSVWMKRGKGDASDYECWDYMYNKNCNSIKVEVQK